MNMFQMAKSLLCNITIPLCNNSLCSLWLWKHFTMFPKGHIIDLNQAMGTTKEIAEMNRIGLRSVQCIIIKTWKGSGAGSSQHTQ